MDPTSIGVSEHEKIAHECNTKFHSQNLKLLLLEQKYLELLENRCDLEALHCLRQDIAGLSIHEYEKKRKIHHLARCGLWRVFLWFIIYYSICSLLMCQNPDELRKTAKWAGVKGGSREHLMDNICGEGCFWLADMSEFE